MLALLLALALGQARPLALPHPAGPLFTNPATLGSLAFFEFAPASGAGMGAACACASITGAKGETVTFTRAGSATCSRQGLATTGIVNGDLVTCATDQPRVEPIGGALGVRVESARTNSVLRSEQINDPAWADDVLGVAAPVITADAATAPDGTLTADRVQLPAVTGAQYSLRRQPIAAGSTGNASVYVRGNGTSGSISIAADGSLATTIDCPYVSTSWSRCTLSAAGSWIFVGTITGYGAASASKGAQDVFLWGAQTEGAGVATYATSYIPTVTAAVTRNDETVFRDETQFGALLGGAGGSVAATAQCLNTANRRIVTLATSGGSPNVEWDVNFPAGAVAVTQWFTGVASTFTSTLAIDSVSRRWAQFTAGAGSTLNICRDGACQAGGSRGANQSGATSLRIHIGNYVSGAFRCDGIVTGVCVSQSPSRCR